MTTSEIREEFKKLQERYAFLKVGLTIRTARRTGEIENGKT